MTTQKREMNQAVGKERVPEVPFLGVGLGLRRKYFSSILDDKGEIDWLEIISENFMDFGGRSRQVLDLCRKKFPVVPHGVGLSLGSTDPLNLTYLESLRRLVQDIRAPFFSDHLCFSSFGGNYHHDLLPLPYTGECVDHLSKRIRICREFLGIPMAVENITDYGRSTQSEMSEAEFLSRVLEDSDAFLLLDINNVYVNSKNHGFDPYGFLQSLPLERVVQMHLAGHSQRGDILVDTHGSAVCDEVWDLYAFALEEIHRPVSTLIEWDNDLPPLKEVVNQVTRARKILLEKFGNESIRIPKDLECGAPRGPLHSRASETIGNSL